MECVKASSLRKLEWEHYHVIYFGVPPDKVRPGPRRLTSLRHASTNSKQYCRLTSVTHPINQLIWRHSSWRIYDAPTGLEEENSSSSHSEQLSDTTELVQKDASENELPQKLTSDELKSLLANSERSKLLRKLSEANQYNRFLKRQMQIKDDALVNFKNELAVLELELQALLGLAEEVANSDPPPGSRKINGKYIQSHLLSRLKVVHEKVNEKIKDVDAVKVQEITLHWVGMAESVQVMGSFDGWSYGEEMSPEYSGADTRFSTTLKLRPGRYEIKFLVDGEWQLSPEFPTIGEGMLRNNLLVVE